MVSKVLFFPDRRAEGDRKVVRKLKTLSVIETGEEKLEIVRLSNWSPEGQRERQTNSERSQRDCEEKHKKQGGKRVRVRNIELQRQRVTVSKSKIREISIQINIYSRPCLIYFVYLSQKEQKHLCSHFHFEPLASHHHITCEPKAKDIQSARGLKAIQVIPNRDSRPLCTKFYTVHVQCMCACFLSHLTGEHD